MSARFFVAQDLQCQTEILLPQAIAHHIRVLRLEASNMITLFNGQGGEYQAQLSALNKQHAIAQILKFTPYERELPIKITLAQAMASGNKMDWLIEKAVELGVYAIQPLHTSRCVVKLSGQRAEQRVRHWQELVHAACEQCGRNQIPQVLAIQPLKDWLNTLEVHTEKELDLRKAVLARPIEKNIAICEASHQEAHSAQPIQRLSSQRTQPSGTTPSKHFCVNPRGVLLSPQGKLSLHQSATLVKDVSEFTLLVGPEGGFSTEEEHLVQQHNFLSTHLGERILRCETAGLSAIAGLTALLNSFQA